MNCEKYFYLIDDLIEGEIDESNASRLEAHLFDCAACRAEAESLRREKEIYAHYLFDVEPPPSLQTNFQARLAAEKAKISRNAPQTANAATEKISIFRFLRFSPAFAAVFLIVCGIVFGFLKLSLNRVEVEQNIAAAKADSAQVSTEEKIQTIFPAEIKNDAQNSRAENKKAENDKIETNGDSLKAKKAGFSVRQPYRAQIDRSEPKILTAQAKKNLPDASEIVEIERQKLQVKSLEKEIAGQIEKIELLLRSFRNAREAENVETFDIEYEKGRARALLEKNARLRRDAENYGVFYAEELLNRAEPYLLDIANLENNPKRGEVLDIKERVKNQNIIASLQVY